ncbi:MAG: flavodoxin family protein [Caldilineaceae bacterium]|nr:flavodoxin family protein [Caldilineaceae bacterium]
MRQVRRRIDDAEVADLLACDALILGSPNWSGMTGKLKDWFDYSGDRWQTGELAGKVGAAFTAGYSRSGGIEATLLQLLHLLFAHGMVVVGLPWTDAMRWPVGFNCRIAPTAPHFSPTSPASHRLPRRWCVSLDHSEAPRN